ncbi:MAG: hypothetical protein WBE34_04330 [Candidatus Nitrosopolaris sp.]
MVNKANDLVAAGRATEVISFNNIYSSAILINNIKSTRVTISFSTPTTSGGRWI